MANTDELTRALTGTWNKRLAVRGFRRVGRRNLISVSSGVVQLFNFQVSAWGSREFCINVASFTLCGNSDRVLEPGFRLRNINGSDMWLPSKSAKAATNSVELAWKAAEAQALPWLERNATLEGHLQVLREETRIAQHHLHFQIGVVEAMLGRRTDALSNLIQAAHLYAEDGRAYCAVYAARSQALRDALRRHTERELLEQWRAANVAVHGIK